VCLRRLEPGERVLCSRCQAAMRPRAGGWQCAICGSRGQGPEPRPGAKCRLCPPDDAEWQGVFSAAGYFDLTARCVHLFKYNRRRELGRAMADLMKSELAGPLGELRQRLSLLTPVPIHWVRRMTRGFNQSDLLAEELSAMLGLPCRHDLLARVRHTRRQALLPRERRAENVRGAFAVRPGARVAGAGILLVDDVVTTGETIGECARVLRAAGAREVWVACFARAGAGRPVDSDDDWAQDVHSMF
jgi:competence protein ComFC